MPRAPSTATRTQTTGWRQLTWPAAKIVDVTHSWPRCGEPNSTGRSLICSLSPGKPIYIRKFVELIDGA